MDNTNNNQTLATEENTNQTVVVDNTALTELKKFGVPEKLAGQIISDCGIETADDLSILTEADLIKAGMKTIPARRLIGFVTKPTAAPVAVDSTRVNTNVSIDQLLPQVPGDISWLQALKAGGVLHVEKPAVIAAVRATLADKVGMYEIPGKLLAAMENNADTSEMPNDPIFYKIRKMLTRRSYADLFETIDGFDGNYVTDSRKKNILGSHESIFLAGRFHFSGAA